MKKKGVQVTHKFLVEMQTCTVFWGVEFGNI